MFYKIVFCQGRQQTAQWLAYLLPDPAALGLIPLFLILWKKLSMLLRLINGSEKWLKMLIEPI